MFLHELVSEQTNKYGFFEYDAKTYKSSFQEHMKNLYQDIPIHGWTYLCWDPYGTGPQHKLLQFISLKRQDWLHLNK